MEKTLTATFDEAAFNRIVAQLDSALCGSYRSKDHHQVKPWFILFLDKYSAHPKLPLIVTTTINALRKEVSPEAAIGIALFF